MKCYMFRHPKGRHHQARINKMERSQKSWIIIPIKDISFLQM